MHKPRILIIEDDTFVSMDLEQTIAAAIDAEIVISPCVAGAKVFMEQHVDFALLDINLVSGKIFELASLLRRCEVPFIFVSGSLREDVPAQLRDVPFILKPYSRSHVLRRLLEMLPDETLEPALLATT